MKNSALYKKFKKKNKKKTEHKNYVETSHQVKFLAAAWT